MANPSSATPEVPAAHEGPHFDNAVSKRPDGPVGTADRESTQRLVWVLFFILILGGVVTGAALGLLQPSP